MSITAYIFISRNTIIFVDTLGSIGPANLTNNYSAGMLSLSLLAGEGWRLQAQANGLAAGFSTNWIYVTDGSVSSMNITVDPTRPTVFYRLAYP